MEQGVHCRTQIFWLRVSGLQLHVLQFYLLSVSSSVKLKKRPKVVNQNFAAISVQFLVRKYKYIIMSWQGRYQPGNIHWLEKTNLQRCCLPSLLTMIRKNSELRTSACVSLFSSSLPIPVPFVPGLLDCKPKGRDHLSPDHGKLLWEPFSLEEGVKNTSYI